MTLTPEQIDEILNWIDHQEKLLEKIKKALNPTIALRDTPPDTPPDNPHGHKNG